MMTPSHPMTETHAKELDARDPLAKYRSEFAIPDARAIAATQGVELPHGPCVYLTGNSLGCQPTRAAALVERELEDWARLGVEGHLHARDPWLAYHEQFRAGLGRLVGAMKHEVVAMNSLTVNLHLLMASFYRPTRDRYQIVIEDGAFPSDSYAVQSQAAWHARSVGFDPANAIVRLSPREGEMTLRTSDILTSMDRSASRVALVLLSGVNYRTGQWFDIPAITSAGHRAGAVVGWDLAHAAGNVPLQLHDWNADFAAWCSYKYLNAGPGAIAGAFVHERHTRQGSPPLPQLAGWWGNDPATRFRMGDDFVPVDAADRWALSNPPILSLTPLKASLALFDSATMMELRAKSLRMSAYLEQLLAEICPSVTMLTPTDPAQRGCQCSLVVPGASRSVQQALLGRGVVTDFREPNVIRIAPVPLYNTFHDVWRVVHELAGAIGRVAAQGGGR
jgi:kynureninase